MQTETQAAPRVSPGPDVTVVDYDGEYTAAEIAKMRAEKQKEIRDLDLKLRMDKVELERMKREAANGVVTSALDGTVLRVNDPDTAKQEGSPVIVVSGGGGYYVKTGVTELDRDKYPGRHPDAHPVVGARRGLRYGGGDLRYPGALLQ